MSSPDGILLYRPINIISCTSLHFCFRLNLFDFVLILIFTCLTTIKSYICTKLIFLWSWGFFIGVSSCLWPILRLWSRSWELLIILSRVMTFTLGYSWVCKQRMFYSCNQQNLLWKLRRLVEELVALNNLVSAGAISRSFTRSTSSVLFK